MALTTQEIKEILAVLEESGWDEAQVAIGDVTLTVSKNGAAMPLPPSPGASPAVGNGASAPATPPPAPPAAPEAGAVAEGHVVSAPSIGLFWRSPEPGAPPFVEVGSSVAEGDTLCIVEVMKLMQQVVADVAGTITAIHVDNGGNVEAGTPLFTIAPADD